MTLALTKSSKFTSSFSFLFLSFFLFLFCLFLIIQSQAAFVNCLYVERFTIIHSKTKIKLPLLSLLLLLFSLNFQYDFRFSSLVTTRASAACAL